MVRKSLCTSSPQTPSPLVQIMLVAWSAPSHYLNQCPKSPPLHNMIQQCMFKLTTGVIHFSPWSRGVGAAHHTPKHLQEALRCPTHHDPQVRVHVGSTPDTIDIIREPCNAYSDPEVSLHVGSTPRHTYTTQDPPLLTMVQQSVFMLALGIIQYSSWSSDQCLHWQHTSRHRYNPGALHSSSWSEVRVHIGRWTGPGKHYPGALHYSPCVANYMDHL